MPAKKSKKYKFGKLDKGVRKFSYETIDAPIVFGESVLTDKIYGKLSNKMKNKLKKAKKVR